MCNALYEMALHQDIQNKLRDEIRVIIKNDPKNLTYEIINEMKYLDKVFNGKL